MITRDQAYEIIQNLNEEAHSRAWDTWIEADELADSDDEEDWEAAEELRETASAEQCSYFREAYDDLDEDSQAAVQHYIDSDQDFREEFVAWYGEEDYEADFG